MINPKFIIVFLSLSFLCVLFSCTNHNHNDKKIFRYNQAEGIASLDPAFAKNQSVMWAIHQLYSTLVEVDESMHIKPALAKSWEFSNDNLSIVFHLRSDVFFHDDAVFMKGQGRKLNATDVVYSFNRIIDASTASPGAWIFNSRVDTVLPFSAINDSTFRIKLVKPFQPILYLKRSCILRHKWVLH